MGRTPIEAFDVPLEVEVAEGEVVILGPDGISGSFTPDAAEQSGKRLVDAAARARSDGEASIRSDGAPFQDNPSPR